MRSAVLSVGERPRWIWRIRFGSPTTRLPNLVGLMPVRGRNALTRSANNCSSVSMTRTVKTDWGGRQSVGCVLTSCTVWSYPITSTTIWTAPPARRLTPRRLLPDDSAGECGPAGRPGPAVADSGSSTPGGGFRTALCGQVGVPRGEGDETGAVGGRFGYGPPDTLEPRRACRGAHLQRGRQFGEATARYSPVSPSR